MSIGSQKGRTGVDCFLNEQEGVRQCVWLYYFFSAIFMVCQILVAAMTFFLGRDEEDKEDSDSDQEVGNSCFAIIKVWTC